MMNIQIKQNIGEIFLLIIICGIFSNILSKQLISGWQNPDIGLTSDIIIEANNAKKNWLSSGLNIRSIELITEGNIDPYASLMSNILISQENAELHEIFAEFPSLPLNLKLKEGLMLANFGRWNQFHTHSMPFASEPRIYKEYINGMLALKGIELYFLAPFSQYLELSLGIYNLIEGHTHDFDPQATSSNYTPEEIAEMLGAIPHGNHYDYQGKHIYEIGDLYNIAGLEAPNDPEIYRGKRKPSEFAYSGRATTSFNIGPEYSIDIGTSILYQAKWKMSKRIDYGFPVSYDKFLGGIDIVFFWHPLTQNRYRNLQTGLESIITKEYYEKIYPYPMLIETLKGGLFGWVDYQHNTNIHIGTFYTFFQPNNIENHTFNLHCGIYLTFSFTHYQYLRVEYSFFNYPSSLDKVSRIIMQYSGSIGYHSHGRKR